MKEYVINNYKFWLPTSFKQKSKVIGLYTHDSHESCYINIKVSDILFIEFLDLIGDRIDLQYYAEQYIE
jgi:hypothetical protein